MTFDPFKSFLMGGFECSTHRYASDGRRLDLVESTRHGEFAEKDYQRLIDLGMRTCRDGLRWHLIEKKPFTYDFSSLKHQARAARKTGMQVIWDYFHYGYPDDLDIYSEHFIERFAAFSAAATNFLMNEVGPELRVCPVNEISFFSWIAAERGIFHPGSRRRGDELKKHLVKAFIASAKEIRKICPDARVLMTEPAINVVPGRQTESVITAAENYRLAQFQAFDMILGRVDPELGGSPQYLDIIGLNYYFHNQWYYPNRKKIAVAHPLYRPFHAILLEYHEKYKMPILIAETGIEDDERPEWFRYVCKETQRARSLGVDVRGICLYPITNHPGWADNRHCHNGLWDFCDKNGDREIYEPLAAEVRTQLTEFEPPPVALGMTE
jgi:beta-glucosidase/6-phospho-beta-glucosidase/beta-galactosidase